MADTPGRLLSSLSNADGRTPKVGGCVGVFFQLFDWNRRLSGKHLFSNKSLPAERPRSKKFDDDKVPMAKLLLIADENRGGFPRTSSSECQSEASSERSSESTSKKPGVVARLMGLESLPETAESHQQLQNRELSKKPPSQQQEDSLRMPQYQELQMLEGLLQRDPDEIWRTPVRKPKLLDPRTSTEFGESPSKSFLREEKMPRSRKKSQGHMEKFAHSPKKSGFSFASVLSPSKNNKVNPPIKSQSGSTTRKSLLLGAATKILEPAARRRPLLEHKPIEKAGRDLKRSLPKDQKQVARDNEKEELARRGLPQTKSTAGLLHRGSNKNGRQQITGTMSHSKLEPVNCDAVEPEEEAQSCECDSPASSSKENRQLPKTGAPVLRRSGSVKEEQPSTPPSRGSLFRSKSVKEEAPAQMDQDCTAKNPAVNKEVRLKREKRQRSVSPAQTTPEPNARKPEPARRKPPLDQGRNSSLQEAQKNAKRSQGQQRSSKGLLSYDRLFGSRKQSKKSEQPGPVKNEEQTRKSTKEDPAPKTKVAPKKSSENSLMKSLLRRKPLSKAETVSSANKKVVEKPKYNKELHPLYERQTRSAGSSPARNFNKDVDTKDNPEYDLLLMCERLADEDTYASDPEVFKERDQEDCERPQTKTASPEKQVDCKAEMPTDRSLEEILKTYLYKSLKSGKEDSSLGKAMAKLENQDGDPNVIDMEVSPADNNTVSRCDGTAGDMPSRVLFDEEHKATTPHSPNKLLSDSKEVTTKVNHAGREDSEQPSPVSVLDFSAFPSDVATTSGEDNDEDAKHSLLSDAESGPASSSTNSSMTMQGILDSYDIRFPELSETSLNEEMASGGDHEIECYVRQVLIGSGLVTGEPRTATVPSSEEISQRLQKQEQLRKLVEFTSEMQVSSKKVDSPGPCQRLMYECIEEALNSVLSPFREDNLDAVAAGCCWKQRPCGEELVAEVTARILAWRDMTLGMVDDVVEADMTTTSAEWSLVRQETVEVGLEVERLVFRSVMEDLITDLVGSNRPALATKLRSGFLSHHHNQQRLRSMVYRG